MKLFIIVRCVTIKLAIPNQIMERWKYMSEKIKHITK